MNRKVTVVGGAGNVGATVARAIAFKELADVVVVDIAGEKASGIALDMLQACPIDGSDVRMTGTTGAPAVNAAMDVTTAGSGRCTYEWQAGDTDDPGTYDVYRTVYPPLSFSRARPGGRRRPTESAPRVRRREPSPRIPAGTRPR